MSKRSSRIIDKDCAHCGIHFHKVVTYGQAKDLYCSRSCSVKARNRGLTELRRIEAQKRKQERIEIRAQKLAALNIRQCKTCGKDYYRKIGRQYCSKECRPSLKEKNREYRRKARKAGTIPRPKDKKRAEFYGVAYEHVNPEDIYIACDAACHVCKAELDWNKRGSYDLDAPEIDHIHPISKGGAHIRENLALICRHCNIKKSNNVIGIGG
jgi:5-methylcytosine-specific restriction endonuclease McrA